MEQERIGARSLVRSTSRVKGCVGAPKWGLGRLTSNSITHMDLHKSNNKLVSAQLEHLWCMDESWANMNSQDLAQPGFEGSHHLPPYNIICAWPWGQHPNVILSQDSQLGSPKIPKIGTPVTLDAHNLVCIPPIEVRSKEKLQPQSKAFQRYVTCHLKVRKSGDFRLLVVGSQIVI